MEMIDGGTKRHNGGHGNERYTMERPRLRLLVVDDDEAMLRSFLRLFGGRLEVWAVSSATAALCLLESGVHVDALLTDYGMGPMNGVELLERVRDAFPKIARFLTSGGGL